MQFDRIEATLNSAAWQGKAAVEPYKSVREQSLHAAQNALDEALVLCSPFIGANRGSQEEDEWKKVVDEFLTRGAGAAIRAADRLIGSRPPLDPTLVPTALQPALGVATKMQALADEVDAASETAMTQSAAGSSLDLALQNLRAVQQAEKELDGEVIQQRLQ